MPSAPASQPRASQTDPTNPASPPTRHPAPGINIRHVSLTIYLRPSASYLRHLRLNPPPNPHATGTMKEQTQHPLSPRAHPAAIPHNRTHVQKRTQLACSRTAVQAIERTWRNKPNWHPPTHPCSGMALHNQTHTQERTQFALPQYAAPVRPIGRAGTNPIGPRQPSHPRPRTTITQSKPTRRAHPAHAHRSENEPNSTSVLPPCLRAAVVSVPLRPTADAANDRTPTIPSGAGRAPPPSDTRRRSPACWPPHPRPGCATDAAAAARPRTPRPPACIGPRRG